MLYAILAYNNSVHSSTKMKPIEVITGHLDNNTLLDLNIEKQLINNYTENHKDRMKIIYNKIHNTLAENKTKVISKLNQSRELYEPELNEKVLVKSKQRMSKLKNKYSPQIVTKIDKKRKTFGTNRAVKKHVSCIRRPPVTSKPIIKPDSNNESLLQDDIDSPSNHPSDRPPSSISTGNNN